MMLDFDKNLFLLATASDVESAYALIGYLTHRIVWVSPNGPPLAAFRLCERDGGKIDVMCCRLREELPKAQTTINLEHSWRVMAQAFIAAWTLSSRGKS